MTTKLATVNKAIATVNRAREYAESVADEMGADYISGLIAFHEKNARAAIDAFMAESKCEDAAIRANIAGNLLRQAGLSAEVAA
ncbi:hypothetical protein SEA_KOZIE_17 [Microbacterium phage Kozie]|uniref:Uncharacterized protein n=1 Tax=Microbacterium phage Kozie TaxID=2885981 RepID=A0AAE8Y8V4_9CAUD|nr:hypothetical protein QC998_gp17 [Microbacterium phage Kozie]UDL16213.1 hypothetical protein SEA_KOZIE_17 [Microbacterium phage Kozie]